jgi:hypothetical protein
MLAYELNDIPQESERERFKIETVDQANWALRKLAAIQSKRDEIERLAKAEIDRIYKWLESETQRLDEDKTYFEYLLNEYAARERAKDPEWKKVSTPYGVIKYRKQQPKWTYDEKKLLESLKSIGRTDLIRVKEEPNKTEIKKALVVKDGTVIDPESGAVLEGVSVEEQPDVVVIEVSV